MTSTIPQHITPERFVRSLRANADRALRIIALSNDQAMPIGEIAVQVRISPNAVRSLLKRARKAGVNLPNLPISEPSISYLEESLPVHGLVRGHKTTVWSADVGLAASVLARLQEARA